MPDLKCTHCGNTDFSENASYCKKCGTPIYNTCTGQCGEPNANDAAFCEWCGAQTIYNEMNVVKPFSDDELPF